jgi:hypothetical protein
MAFMYCKLFASLYQGTLRGKPHEILVFTNMLAHADAEGYVDKHFRAIADEVGLSADEVKIAIACLEGPDDESRSPEMEGRRIVRVNDSRAWGWHVVNYGKYRAIKNDEDRRESNRKAQEKWREKQKLLKLGISTDKQCVSTDNHESSPSAQGEEEADGEGKEEVYEKRSKKKTFTIEFPEGLQLEYLEPLTEWWNYKKEKGDKYTKSGWLKLIENQRSFTPLEVKASVNKSMSNNWKGLFTDKITSEEIDLITPKPLPRIVEPDIDLMALMLENRAKAIAKEAEASEEPSLTEESTWS